jgi:WD40 repeat protein
MRTAIWRALALSAGIGQAATAASAQQVSATLTQDSPVTALALSPDGRLVAAGMTNGTIALWDLRTQRRLRAMSGASGRVRGLAFAPSGKALASISAGDDTARLWDPATGQAGRVLSLFAIDGVSAGFSALAYAPDGVTVVLGEGGGRVTLWDTTTGAHRRLPSPHDAIVTGVAVTPDGSLVVSVDFTRRVRIRPIQPGRDAESLGTIGDEGLNGLAIAPDGITLALGGSAKVYHKPQTTYPITLWDLHARKMLASLESNPSPASALAISAGGRILGSMGPDNVVRIWSLVTRKQLFEVPGSSFSLSGAGKVLVVAQDKSVKVVRVP